MAKNNLLFTFIPLLLLSSCGSSNQGSKQNSNVYDEGYTNGVTETGYTTYYAKKPRTHIGAYNIPDTNIVFAESNLTDYSFVITERSDTVSAKIASYCQGHIYNATGASISIAYSNVINTNDKCIVLNNVDAMAKNGIEVDQSLDLLHGYQIVRKDNCVFIYAPNSESAQLAAIKFLSTLVGYDCLGNSTYIYEKNGTKLKQGNKVMLPDYALKEIPDGTTRLRGPKISEADRYDMGFSEITELIPVEGSTWHNCLSVLPVSKYGSTHPGWYSADRAQICYTAHGNENELNEMADVVADLIAKAAINPSYSNYYRTGFFQSDGADLCLCDACTESAKYYGDGDTGLVLAHSAAMIKFINKVADRFYEDPRIKGTDRENVNLGIFAYQDSCQAPISHTEDVKLNDKVTVYIAPSRLGGTPVSWTEPLLPEYGGVQEAQYNNLINWGNLTNNIGFWGYSTLFQNYLIPFDVFSSMVEDARLAYDIGANWIEFQNEFVAEGHTGFTYFKSYINSKTLIDVNLEYNDIKDRFFANFYGDAGEIMLQYFNELEEINRYLRLSGVVSGYLGQTFSNPASLFGFESVLHFADIIDTALELIRPLALTNNSLYKTLKTNIEYEGIFPHYFLTVYHEKKLNPELTTKYRNMLYQECVDTKFNYFNESAGQNGESLFQTLFKNWGF